MKSKLLLTFVAIFAFTSLFAQKLDKTTRDVCPNQSQTVIDNGNKVQWDINRTFEANGPARPGLETDGTNFYTCVWNDSTFTRYDMDGSNPTDFKITGVSSIRDLAYDGQYFYGSNATLNLYQMDLANGTLISTITVSCTGITGIRHIAYDPRLDGGNGGFWIGNWTELGAIKKDGTELVPNSSTPTLASVYGSAYDDWSDRANPKLWLFTQPSSSAIFEEFDINTLTLTGVTHNANDIPGFTEGSAGGACSFEEDGKFLLAGNIQQDPNLIGIYDLAYTADLDAPCEPGNFVATEGASGALELSVEWTNPAFSVAGDALTELTAVYLIVAGDTLFENMSPTIGGNENTGTLSIDAPGNKLVRVIGKNSVGFGIPVETYVYVGEDVPAAVNDLAATDNGTDITLTWTAPTAGAHGAVFYPSNITGYEIQRNGVVLATVTELTYTDANPGGGIYTYKVTPINSVGAGEEETIGYIIGVIAMANSTISTCSAVFSDDGGESGNYSNSSNLTFTISPGDASKTIKVEFVEMNIENGYDHLYVFEGDAITTDTLADMTGTNFASFGANGIFTGAAVGEALTFKFTSDNSVNRSGWLAIVTCIDGATTQTVTFNVNMNTPAATAANFNAGTDSVFVSGDLNLTPVWPEPGVEPTVKLLDPDNDGIYTLELPIVDGDYEYKYFINYGWDGGEWDGGNNRPLTIAGGESKTLNDNFGEDNAIENVTSNLEIYPNPSNGIININLDSKSTVNIYNLAGQIIYSQIHNSNSTIDLTNVQAGVYMINVISEGQTAKAKVIIK